MIGLKTKKPLTIAASIGLVALPAFETNPDRDRPSFVIFLADDLGYGDLACYGNSINSTPNLDRFAGEGVMLTNCHSAGTVCSPSRAGILTGRNPYRSGFSYIAGGKTYLRAGEITIAELLKQEGYQTAFFGKWHLSNLADTLQPDPGDQGFDYWMATSVNAFEGPENPLHFIRNGKRTGVQQGWYCDIIVKESLDWLSRIDKKKPFLLVICTHEPHTPIDPPDSLTAAYQDPALLPKIREMGYGKVDREGKYNQANAAKYFGTIKQLDNAFGEFINGLDNSGLKKNTLVMFTSDNGPEHPVNFEESRGEWDDPIREKCYGTPGPFRGMKRYPTEGGHRVPGLVRFPGRIKAGTVSEQLFNGTDILPVFCGLANCKVPADRKIDGEPVFEALRGKPADRKNPVLWIFPAHEDTYFRMPQISLMQGKYTLLGWFPPKEEVQKIVPWVKQSVPARFELYDIQKDPGQDIDISPSFPEVTEKLSREIIRLWLDIREDYKLVTRDPSP